MTVTADDFDARFSSLEASNRLLAQDVRALTATIQIVSDLQIEQRKINERNAETERKVATVAKETDEKIAHNRQRATRTAVILAILLPIVSIVVYALLIDHVNELLNQQAHDRKAACLTRNAGTLADARREESLAAIEVNPTAKAIHEKSAAEIRGNVINCAKLYANVK